MTVAAVAIVSYVLAQLLSRPFTNLRAALGGVATGDCDRYIFEKRNDEPGQDFHRFQQDACLCWAHNEGLAMRSRMKSKSRRSRPEIGVCLALALGAMLWACGLFRPSLQPSVVARSSDFVVVVAGSGDTLGSLAETYLGDRSKGWIIAEFNAVDRIRAGQQVVIPLRPVNAARVFADGYQTVPVLVYHRLTRNQRSDDRLVISAEAFTRQLSYLGDHGYRVIRLSDLARFIAGKAVVPPKSVVLTFDDGYKSVYKVAYPILRKYRFPATIFLYSDFVGAPAGLTWTEMKEMVASGLVDIQPHSKSHANLTITADGEDEAAYRRRVRQEIRHPARQIEKHLGLSIHSFAYPYGAANDTLIASLEAEGYAMGATVTRGGNASFAHPYLLRRTMIYGDDDIATFAKRLDVFRRLGS